MLLNRLMERSRQLRLRIRLLRRRARLVRDRRPLVVVPSILGTRLADQRGRLLWGGVRRLYFGPAVGDETDVVTAGLLHGFTILPGLLHYDVFGGLLRFLADVGGYVPGEDLHVVEYDWRGGIAHAGQQLGETLARLRGAGEERFDLLGMSTGGLATRWLLAQGPDIVLVTPAPPATVWATQTAVLLPFAGSMPYTAWVSRPSRVSSTSDVPFWGASGGEVKLPTVTSEPMILN